MINHLKPCPFCGGDASFNDHTDGCYFIVLRKLKADPPADLSRVPDLIEAWNIRTAIQQAESEPALPDGYVVAPHFRGYARLGIGAYLINHSAPGHEPELVISVATEDEKAGRSVGEERDNAPGSEIQPEQISVRLCFENVAGLDALEKQLRYLREVHFSGTHPAPGVPDDVVRDAERYRWLLCNYLKFSLPDEAWKHGSLDAAIDAAMTASPTQKGGE